MSVMQNIVAAIAAETLAASLPFSKDVLNWTSLRAQGMGVFYL